MTDPNQPTPEETLAARELIKGWLPTSFVKAIDAGQLDGFGLFNRALAELMRAPVIAEGDEA